jgi:hypothetical protein
MNKTVTAAAVAAAMLAGAGASAAIFVPHLAGADTGTSTPTSTPGYDRHGPGGPGGFGGRHELVSDASVVAKAIGISEADLRSALQSGKTIADVAKAHNVGPKKVIDALVADGQSELADAVKNGRLTQAQADEMKTHITEHATDQVNGTFHGGPRLHDGPGGRGGFGGPGGPGPDGPGRVDNPSTAPSSASV